MMGAITILFTITQLFGTTADLDIAGSNRLGVGDKACVVDDNVRVIGCVDNETSMKFAEILSENSAESAGCSQQPWKYVIVHEEEVKQKLVSVFLSEMTKYHKFKKIPFEKVIEFWQDVFTAPVVIFVFADNNIICDYDAMTLKDAFSTYPACYDIITTAKAHNLGFLWMGTMSIVEDEIKELLEIPVDHELITTLVLEDLSEKRVTQVP